jgi:hypothetical protein
MLLCEQITTSSMRQQLAEHSHLKRRSGVGVASCSIGMHPDTAITPSPSPFHNLAMNVSFTRCSGICSKATLRIELGDEVFVQPENFSFDSYVVE